MARPTFSTPVPVTGNSCPAISTALQALRGWVGFPALEQAMREFKDTEIFLTGGVLRDSIQPDFRAPKDFDLFMGQVNPNEFLTRIAETGRVELGPFGSPRWFPLGNAGTYADIVPIERFYNGLWKCADILDVLNQFDFTANAIALNLRSRELFDPQNGVRDARARIIRAVRFDYPDEPLPSDSRLSRLGILWIRLIHYANTLKFDIEPVTKKWLLDNSQFDLQKKAFGEVFFEPSLGVIGVRRKLENE